MSTDLIQHAFHGQSVRVITDEHGNPWFIAADVARVLGYSATSAMTRRLDDDDKGVRTLHTPGGDQDMTVITEPGLYSAVFGSQVERALEFKRWVTTEVLPTIRRTGSYGSPSFDLTRIDDITLLVQAAANAVQRVRELEPPAQAWHAMAESSGDYSLRDAAQILDRDPSIKTGQNRLGQYLRQIGWLDKRGIPYQRHVDLGRIQSRVRTYKHPRTGETVTADPQVRITVKGLGDLHKLLGGSVALDARPALEVVA